MQPFTSPMYLTPTPPAPRRFHGVDYARRTAGFGPRYARRAAPASTAMPPLRLPVRTIARIGGARPRSDYGRAA
ncbi:hypothetical protein [Agrilutibacter solisilvae]|uniref:Uncharacterized protein n=1 Tax=Agrilutibacter solisilvae TaxID=2763317 RepID=A0A975ATN6_9GAMM|nr:hypothetical protein [Lysobacter solisilvae]QSX79195.1 hypothetical protein I8J32_004685 [Lysobacter solisilvae]